MIGLVELAQRYVSLSAQLEETRNAMRAALMKGSDGNPTMAGSPDPPNKGLDREAVLVQSKAADERVLALLREKPMRPSEIVRATQGKLSTTSLVFPSAPEILPRECVGTAMTFSAEAPCEVNLSRY
jgi:hypothetical protein